LRRRLLDLLACPLCAGDLGADAPVDEIDAGTLTCGGCRAAYPIVGGIPRFVPPDNYADTFGLQWNRFRRTQLDSYSGVPISRERFFQQSGWDARDLAGALVLDVGCGAGRFAEIAAGCGAEVVAIDFSSSVDACRENVAAWNMHVVQADMYQLPLKPCRFDFVYCFGVLQHTPNVRDAFLALPAQLKPGGRLAVDVYPKLALNALWPKYWLRPFTSRVPADRLFRAVERAVPALWPLVRALGRVPLVGRKLRYLIPVANYEGVYPLSAEQLREWAVLDTFDMLAPRHDHPQSKATLREWFAAAPLGDIEVFRSGFVIGRGVRTCGRRS
jgi:SAM-dependent methyltransferase